MNELVFLSTGFLDGAFPSQVLAPLNVVREQFGCNVLHLAMEPYRNFGTTRGAMRRSELRDLPPTVDFRCARFFGRMSLNADAFSLKRRFGDVASGAIIQARTAENAFRALKAFGRNAHVIAEIRGDSHDELGRYSAGRARRVINTLRCAELRKIERYVGKHASQILCVSTRLREKYVECYGANRDKVIVLPSTVNERKFAFCGKSRKNTRAKYSFGDKRILLYSGGMAPWQGVQYVVEFFKSARLKDPNCFLVVATRDKKSAHDLFAHEFPADSYAVLSLPHSQMPGLYAAADVGLLLRDRTPTNEVAAPMKLSEYLVSGLPVIATCGIGDTDDYVSLLRSGVLVATPNDAIRNPLSVGPASEEERRRISTAAIKIFGVWHRYGDRGGEIYRGLLSRLGQK